MLLCERNVEDAASESCSAGSVLSACSRPTRDPPIWGRESEKRSLPYTWAPLEDWVRSLLMSPSRVDSKKRSEEARKKGTVTVC